ncbi:MAG: methyltransferase domain-containing protein [Burkholderiales bacterium]
MATGAAEAKQKGLTNVRFLNKDAATLDGSDQYDFITTFDAVHDQARPDLALSGIANSLRPGGQYLCVDIAAWSSWCRETRSGRRTTKVGRSRGGPSGPPRPKFKSRKPRAQGLGHSYPRGGANVAPRRSTSVPK